MNRVLSFFEHVAVATGKGAAKVAEVAVPIAVNVLPLVFPPAAPLALPMNLLVSTMHKSVIGADPMNPLETFAITMVLGMLQGTVKNPAHKQLLENQLVGIATDIFNAYGMVPPPPPVTQSAAH